jgi:hypothetical protein
VAKGLASSCIRRGSPCAWRRRARPTNTAKLIHETRNPGTVPAKALAVFIVEKGKPLVNPVS